MKKHLLLLIVLCLSFAMQAKNTLVSTKTAFTTAWGVAANGDTITVAYNGGVILNTGAVNLPAAGGVITVRGLSPDSLPIIQSEFDGVTLADGVTTGLIFENLHIQYQKPDGTSGQVIYFNKKYANMTKVIFRNCEISRTVRSLFRSVKPDSISPTQRWDSCGDVEYFEMSNCKVHNTTLTSGNNWPLVYFGHLPVEVNFKNNTFYDLPYLKDIFTMNYADANQGRNAIINFENNTVCFSPSQAALIATGSYLGQEAQFNIKNNVFLVPNWVNATNLDPATYAKPKILSARYGIVTASNNLVQGYNSWASGQSLDVDLQGGFVSLDTIPQYTMASLGVAWTDFTDPANGKYTYMSSCPLATASSTGGPIGDPRWVLSYVNPRSLVAKANITGAVITPLKGLYEDGTSVKLTASVVVGYSFKAWKDTLGNLISTANPYTFTINSNVNVVATYEARTPCAVNVALTGSKTATYSISPVQSTYYLGDVITTTVNTHYINDLLNWSDGKLTTVRIDSLIAPLNITASFYEYPYLLSWDFHQLTANNATFNNLAANHFKDTLNMGSMYYVGKDTLSPNFQTRNNKFAAAELAYCALRKTPAANFANPDYLVIRFSTKGQTGLKVKSAIASDNYIQKVQKMQYSLNGVDYVDFAAETLPDGLTAAFSTWFNLDGSLPVEANNRDTLYVRWKSDPTSALIASSDVAATFEYVYISKIVVLSDQGNSVASNKESTMVAYSSGGTLFIRTDKAQMANIYNLMGQCVRTTRLNEGQNEIKGLNRGLYIVRSDNKITKVIL